MIRHGLALHIAEKDLIGVPFPRGWGLAYRKHSVRYVVLYPLPINLIVRYAIILYWLIYRWIVVGGWKDKLDDEYWRGYNDGNTAREHHYDRLARIILGKES